MRRGKNKCVHVELDDVSGTLPSSTGQQDAGKKNIIGESNNKKAAGKKFPILAIVAVLFLVLLPISVYFGYAEYVRLQKEKERDGLFWDMRVKFDYLKNDRTAQYVRVGDISVRDSVLDVEVLRTYLYSKGNSRYGGFDALKKVARDEVLSLIPMNPEHWTDIISKLCSLQMNIRFIYRAGRDNMQIPIEFTYQEFKEVAENIEMMSKAQDIFVHNKCEEVLSYAKMHFKNDRAFKVDSVSLDEQYVKLHLSYSSAVANLGESFTDSTHVPAHYLDKVGYLGSILDNMLFICALENKGFAFVYYDKKTKSSKVVAWDAERTAPYIKSLENRIILDSQQANRVKTVVRKHK